MTQEDLKQVEQEIRKTFEVLKNQNDQALMETRKTGMAYAETRETLERINQELTGLRKKQKDLERRLGRPGLPFSENHDTDPEKEVRKRAFEKVLRYGAGENGLSVFTPEEKRALSSLSDAEGGFLTPPEWETAILMNAYDVAEIRPIAGAGTTGRDMVMLGALSSPVVSWGRVNVAVTPQNLATGAERIHIFDLKALTLIHNNTLEDTHADIGQEITMAFSRAISEAEDDAFANGEGDESPKGIASDSRVQANAVNSGVSDDIADATHNGTDALIEVMYTVKKAYRRNGYWAMNSSTEAEVRKLKDEDGRYLWQPSAEKGVPPTLLGRPIINPEGLPDIAANAYPILFGDFKAGYRIYDRAGISVQRLSERYAEYDQTGFLVKKRVGGQVILAEAFSCMKCAA